MFLILAVLQSVDRYIVVLISISLRMNETEHFSHLLIEYLVISSSVKFLFLYFAYSQSLCINTHSPDNDGEERES